MIKKPNKNQMQVLEGGKRFWVWEYRPSYPPTTDLGGDSKNCCYKIFWGATVCNVFTNDNLPGNNPRPN